jgi:SAM-dependent methyltransferase
MEKFGLEKIGELSVTDRGLDQVLEDMGIEESEIDNFPKDGTVLNIGSGLYQKFEEDLKKKRDDLKVVSVDPSLSLDKQNLEKGDWYIEKLGGSIAQYKDKDQPKMKWGKDLTIKNPEEFQEERLKKIREAGSNSVAALAPQLPFKSGSFDVIIDCVASMRYLKDEEDRKENLLSICDLLKAEGSAYITSLKKSELEAIDEDFQIEFLREYEGDNVKYCDVKITKKIKEKEPSA